MPAFAHETAVFAHADHAAATDAVRKALSAALYEPSGACTPSRSNTQAGKGTSDIARPWAMSSRTISATAVQPAACQVSNGPCAQPKPQRMAKSMSRALSAMSARCTAM